MILNISAIKTEALLLFCRDLIISYKNVDMDFYLDEDLKKEFLAINEEILIQISYVTNDSKYYLENRANFRIKAILKAYSFINDELNKALKTNEKFNPSMLFFSLLTLWFKELNKESKSKFFIFFTLYPYSKIYDKFLLKNKSLEYKNINIKMITLAEKIILRYDDFII